MVVEVEDGSVNHSGMISISLTGVTVGNIMPPLSVSKTRVNKQHSLITTTSS